MGLNLSGGKPSGKSKAKKPAKPVKETKQTKPVKQTKLGKSKVKQEVMELEQGDEVVEPEEVVAPVEKEEPVVEILGAFEGGLVNPALRNAVSVSSAWRHTADAVLFTAIQEHAQRTGVFIGSIYVKSSFINRTGGAALL